MVQFNLLLEGVILCAAICLVLTWRLKTNFQLYGLPILATLILGALLDGLEHNGGSRPNEEPAAVNEELPPVVHILLDAFSGIDGLPPYPASDVMRNELHQFFDNYGFQTFPRAYSHYALTGDSLYSAMNFKNDGNSEFALEVENRQVHILKSNALFDSLAKIGYRINVYQTGHLDFCQSNPDNVDLCWSYTHPYVASLRQVNDLQLRVSNLAGILLKQSTLIADLFQSRKWFLDMGVTNHDPRIFSNLQKDLLNKPAGRYFFAHVLLPHGPFAYLHDCSINYETDRVTRFPYSKIESGHEDSVLEARAGLYLEQMECSLVSLSKIFDSMKQINIFEKSIIVIHGDHGSMVGNQFAIFRNIENLTPTDYRSNYSTLFAVKLPNGKYHVDDRVLSLDVLLEAFSNTVQSSVIPQEEPPTELQLSINDKQRLNHFIFLTGTYPLYPVDINIFDD